jgi:hypothetical protein
MTKYHTSALPNAFILQPRQLKLATSATPNAVTNMAPKLAAAIVTSTVSTVVIATVTTTDCHCLVAGETFTVSGATSTSAAFINGIFTVATVTNPKVFTYIPAGAATGETNNSCFVTYSAYAQSIIIKADANNTDVIWFGSTADADFDSLAAGMTYNLGVVGGGDLADWNVKSATASQNYRLLYV